MIVIAHNAGVYTLACGERNGYFPGRMTNKTEKSLIVLGLESSCDETAAALVRLNPDGSRIVLAEHLASQIGEHRTTGGVVPEVAARAHLLQIDGLVRGCLNDAGVTISEIDAVAATAGPGLIGGVMVGMMVGKGIAAAANKPFLAINHLAGHALSPRLIEDLEFPYLLLLVSGGHCQLLLVEGVDRFKRLGTTLDDAAGEAFDKAAKLLGLGYPGGPLIEAAARRGDAKHYPLPAPLVGTPNANFSFSGLKTALRTQLEKIAEPTVQDRDDLAASFQAATVACLVDRTAVALKILVEQGMKPTALVAAGGVAANGAIREALEILAGKSQLKFIAPPLSLCTDNAAMIAWAGIERLRLGQTDALDVTARPRWPLDADAAKPGAKA